LLVAWIQNGSATANESAWINITTTTANNPFAGIFDTDNMDDLGWLLPPNFKHNLFTVNPSAT
jgi:hypothetical protein